MNHDDAVDLAHLDALENAHGEESGQERGAGADSGPGGSTESEPGIWRPWPCFLCGRDCRETFQDRQAYREAGVCAACLGVQDGVNLTDYRV